ASSVAQYAAIAHAAGAKIVQHGFQNTGDRNADALTGLALLEANELAVIGVPCEFEQVALALPCPERQQHGHLKRLGGHREEFSHVGRRPYLFGPIGRVEPPAAFAWVGLDL